MSSCAVQIITASTLIVFGSIGFGALVGRLFLQQPDPRPRGAAREGAP